MTARPLLIIPPVTAHRDSSGGLVMTRKFFSGMQAYAAHWPGRVVALVHVAALPDSNLDHELFRPADWSFDLRALPAGTGDLEGELRAAALVVLGEEPYGRRRAEDCARLGVPFVNLLEWDPRTRRQILWHQSPDPLRAAWRILWSEWESRARRRVLRKAAGLQCNGTPVHESYGRLNPRSLLFFDSRVTETMVADQALLERRTGELKAGAPLRLIFSGRFVEIKGVDHLPRVAQRLVELQVPFTLDLCGSGPLVEAVRRDCAERGLGDRIRFHGTLDFETQLIPMVRDRADLFVCCHLQGDPSCTYLETLACGVPVAGYPNVALEGLAARSQAAWCARDFRAGTLADLIAGLHRDRSALAAAAFAARSFALEHTFEKTMGRRVDHFLQCSGSPGGA